MLEVFFGSGIGGVFRYLLNLLSMKIFNDSWPGTLFVNVVGAFILIFLISKFDLNNFNYSKMVTVGFLGGFTTFSTFSYEIFQKISSGNYLQALLIFSLNVVLGIMMAVFIFR